jgi:DNA-binding IclR family transcriptional regulator
MNNPDLLSRVEHALTHLDRGNQPITFTAIARTTGVARATLYRNLDLRTLIEEHRTRATDARTLTGLATHLTHLHNTVEALATRVRHHEEQLRRLQHRPTTKPQ